MAVVATGAFYVTDTIDAGRDLADLAVSPSGDRLYVSNPTDRCIRVFETHGLSIVDTTPRGFCPAGLCLSPDGKRLYVANRSGDYLYVLATHDMSVVDSLALGAPQEDVAVSPDETRLYASTRDGTAFLDVQSHAVLVTSPHTGASIIVASDSGFAYLSGSPAVVLRLVDLSALACIPASIASNGVALMPDRSRVYVIAADEYWPFGSYLMVVTR